METKENFYEEIEIKTKLINNEIGLPKYKIHGDSGFDLYAMEDIILEPGQTTTVRVGLAFELPLGVELQVRPRSGISSKTKLRIVLGTGDSVYRGEYRVIVDNFAYPKYYLNKNTGQIEFLKSRHVLNLEGNYEELNDSYPVGTIIIHKGDRIAQGILCRVIKGVFIESEELSETQRGSGGFGHTGVK
jgi:dUTP pyrophosphatase